jgi:hypothetical protein
MKHRRKPTPAEHAATWGEPRIDPNPEGGRSSLQHSTLLPNPPRGPASPWSWRRWSLSLAQAKRQGQGELFPGHCSRDPWEVKLRELQNARRKETKRP